MEIVTTGSFAVDHVIEADGAVDLGVDIVLALNDVFGRSQWWGLFFHINLSPFGVGSVEMMRWVYVLRFGLVSLWGCGVFGWWWFLFHGFGDVFTGEEALAAPGGILACDWDSIFAATYDNDEYDDN